MLSAAEYSHKPYALHSSAPKSAPLCFPPSTALARQWEAHARPSAQPLPCHGETQLVQGSPKEQRGVILLQAVNNKGLGCSLLGLNPGENVDRDELAAGSS